ncbi:ornithine carbamoyltransferase [Clostridium massiliamazoniense]|uniref:ornithine carbamoyltransferase n=1 Tax=Clostridium massiliamazoniense TaxID=1347366 RepID=UPI0006D7CE62|nr:ornithine carbamoyltransferase [Clostridium massiliamazoniense]
MNLRGKSFLSLMDFNREEIRYLLDLAHELKEKKKKRILGNSLEGKNIVLLFDKTSTRTRCAFEVAALDEGAHVTYLTNSQMGKKESIEDTAKVLGRMYDGIEYRGFSQELVENLAKYSGVPVWNGLTDIDHPTQVLADFMTIEEKINKPLEEVKFVFVGDIRNNMSYALMYGAAKMGMEFVALGPKKLTLDNDILERVKEECNKSGGKIIITDDIESIKGADVIYTDVWVSMGEEEKILERVELLKDYKITDEILRKTENKDVLFMHCLPAFHDFTTETAKNARDNLNIDIREVEDAVFRSRNSVVFDEAENRMHSIKAIMVATLKN